MKNLLYIPFIFFYCTAVAQEKITINQIHKDSVRFYIGFQKPDEVFNYLQAAQKFHTDKAECLLKLVELHRAIIPVNDTKSPGELSGTTFILKIYDVDSLTGAPGKSLLKEPLITKNGSNPLVKIDLSKFNIIIPGKTFFVGIEWIFTDRNQRLMNITYDRFVKDKRYVVANPIYQPFIGMVKNNKSTSDAWVFTQEHIWKLYTHNMPYMTDLAISAVLITKGANL